MTPIHEPRPVCELLIQANERRDALLKRQLIEQEEFEDQLEVLDEDED